MHHPVFENFTKSTDTVSSEFVIEFIGAKFRTDFYTSFQAMNKKISEEDIKHFTRSANHPPFSQDYFEWIEILDSVMEAGDSYRMIELGAGYGHWSTIATLAAKQRKIKNIKTWAVEADPAHAQWIKMCYADNKMSLNNHKIVEAAIGQNGGSVPFVVVPPNNNGEIDASDWYGQYIGLLAKNLNVVMRSREGVDYYGHPIKFRQDGLGVIEVPAISLETIIGNEDYIDLIDMDIQGAELIVIKQSREILKSSVKRLHIGTHGADIDGSLIQILREDGWINRRVYLSNQKQETPYGTIDFLDGVQTWINPAFV